MKFIKILKVVILTLASLIVVFRSYEYLELLNFAPFSQAIPVWWHSKVIRPFCNCSSSHIEYILVEKVSARTPKDEDLLVINMIKEEKSSSLITTRTTTTSNDTSTTKIKTYLFNLTLTQAKQFTKTCDMFNVLRRGLNQKIISYSFYGRNPKYSRNLEGIVEIMRLKYSAFTARVHYDSSIDLRMRCRMECLYPDVMDFCDMNAFSTSVSDEILVEETDSVEGERADKKRRRRANVLDMTHMHKMMWRFLPVGDSFVDVFMSRDTDSFFTDREVDAVNAWLNSNKPVHIMRGQVLFVSFFFIFFIFRYMIRIS